MFSTRQVKRQSEQDFVERKQKQNKTKQKERERWSPAVLLLASELFFVSRQRSS